jgi:undecaprenyl-diphosphatase
MSHASDPTRREISRHPADARRMAVFLLVTAFGYAAAVAATRTTSGVESDLRHLLAGLPQAAVVLLVLAVQVAHLLLFLGIPLVLLVGRQWRNWAIFTGGYVLAFVLAQAASWATQPNDPLPLPDLGLAQHTGTGWPPSSSVATATAALIMLSPNLNRSWRRFGWAFVAVLAVVRILTASDVVFDIALSFGIGGAVGYLVLLVFGRPLQVPTPQGVRQALARLGLPDAAVAETGHRGRGSLLFRAELPDGDAVHCKVLTATQYEADTLWRAYRRVRVRELGEDIAYSTVRRAAAVEGMLAMTARTAGAATPAVRGVAAIGDTEMLIAFDEIPGSTLNLLQPQALTDEVLRQAWASVAALRTAQIAHRDLQLSSWLLDGSGRLWLIDFSFGEPAATDGALRSDIAELLAATYPMVGAERAVAAALAVLGPQVLATGISHLVPVALTRATRASLKPAGGLDPLVAEAARACGVAQPQFAAIERVKPRNLLMAGLLAVAVYVLLPQLADLPRMIDAIREADPAFAAAAAAASLATYVGVALALVGSITAPIRFRYGFLAAWASSFVGAVAPPGVAHVGLNIRLAQRQGLDSSAAVSAAAAKEVAVGSVHVVLLILAAILAGSSEALRKELDRLPSPTTIGIGVAVLLAVLGLAAATPRARRFLRETVVPAVRQSIGTLRALASDPARMLTLFSGALILQVGYIGALYCSVRALGGDIPLLTVALLYLTVGSAASVAPTPGGVGAVEAVLLAALTGVGMAAAPALAAVFLYRLMTFWVPIPIGALAMRSLTAREVL